MDSVSMAATVATAGGATELYTEIEALHLSRQDNPFIQKVSASQDNLDSMAAAEAAAAPPRGLSGFFKRCGSQSAVSTSQSLMSPEPPYSPTRSCDPLALEEVHSHLVRSPPPVTWPERAFPLSPRSNGTFSPDSSDGMELDYGGPASGSSSSNYYTRSQSEEHILSPCRDLLRNSGVSAAAGGGGGGLSAAGLFLPVHRGTTPELLMTASMHEPSVMSPKSNTKIRRNHTLNLSSSGEEAALGSPYRNKTGFFESEFQISPSLFLLLSFSSLYVPFSLRFLR